MCSTTILESIQEKYSDENEDDYGFIVFVSNSPEMKKGLYPPVMTLCDYNISSVGCNEQRRLSLIHIIELDLTDNLISDWAEVFRLLSTFSGLQFLNLSNNLLNSPLPESLSQNCISASFSVKKLILNNNHLDWKSICHLIQSMPSLEELHLSNNNLQNPSSSEGFYHSNLRALYLSRNPQLSDYCQCNNVLRLPSLNYLVLSETGVEFIPKENNFPVLKALNVTKTLISDWTQIDKLRTFSSLSELRLMHNSFREKISAHERRLLLIARLPNIQILNGGDVISYSEREDAERAFIRFYDKFESERPQRWKELVLIYGRLNPLVNIDLAPKTHVYLFIVFENERREEYIHLYQTVSQLKSLCSKWFNFPSGIMKLYYVDQVLSNHLGPEEMKWSQKELYTYNVQNGDSIIVDRRKSSFRPKTTIFKSYASSSPNSSSSEESSQSSQGSQHSSSLDSFSLSLS